MGIWNLLLLQSNLGQRKTPTSESRRVSNRLGSEPTSNLWTAENRSSQSTYTLGHRKDGTSNILWLEAEELVARTELVIYELG